MDNQDSTLLQKHLNEHQVSEITGLSVKTLQKYRHDMSGRVCEIGSSCFISAIEFGRWLNSKGWILMNIIYPSKNFQVALILIEKILNLLNLNPLCTGDWNNGRVIKQNRRSIDSGFKANVNDPKQWTDFVEDSQGGVLTNGIGVVLHPDSELVGLV